MCAKKKGEAEMMLVWNILLLVAGFVLLIKGADFFVVGASRIAQRFGIPEIVIGLTIVAFGTSAPEAAISISAAVQGNTGIAIGNILGSNILNILIILGVTACIANLPVSKTTVKYEMPFVIFVSVVLLVLAVTAGELNTFAGIVLWVLFIAFFVYLIVISKKGGNKEISDVDELAIKEVRKKGGAKAVLIAIVMTVGGLAAVVIGSNLAIDGATYIAKFFGMSDRLIGLTIVALGTSLPELVTSITAARKGNTDIAIGNIVGSNIFNILFVLGTTALIAPVPFESKFIVDGVVCIASAVMLFLFVLNKDRKLKRSGGIVMLLSYAAYFVYLLVS